MEELLEPQNRHRLSKLVKNHIVKGNILLKDLKDGDILTSVSGKELSVQVKEGNVSIDNVAAQSLHAHTINGMIHFVDSVLVTK